MDDSTTPARPGQSIRVDGLQVAKTLAARGFRVFPLRRGAKAPSNKQGFRSASSDPGEWSDETGAWWHGLHSGDNVGVATGSYGDDRHLVVIDLDRHEGQADGVTAWEGLTADKGDWSTLLVQTPHEGAHLFYWSNVAVASGPALAPGIDIKATGGYVVGPGSMSADGSWSIALDAPIADIPPWLAEWVAAPRKREREREKMAQWPAPARPEPLTPRLGDRPSDLWAAQTSWESLIGRLGGHMGPPGPDGVIWVTRPGKDPRDGHSATLNHGGDDRLFVFSSSWPGLRGNWGYSKLDALVAIHGGDFQAALDEARSALGRSAPSRARTPRVDMVTGEILEELPRSEGPTMIAAEFWEARRELSKIRQAAHSRQRSPDAMFGIVLARVAAMMPNTIVLPAISGATAPVNVCVAIIGPSGAGKSSVVSAAEDLTPAPFNAQFRTLGLGSGEGLIEAYLGWEVHKDEEGNKTKEKVQTATSVLFNLDEGQALAEMSARRGSTIMANIRGAWSGGPLGNANAGEDTKRQLARGSYRFALIAGWQTEHAGALLTDEVGGTPQRFLWFSAVDPALPDKRPDWPGALDVYIPDRRHTAEIDVDPDVRKEISDRQGDVIRGVLALDPLDSHRDLSKLKVAALLAFIDRRLDINPEDWALAEMVMTASDGVRRHVAAVGVAKGRAEEHAATERAIRREVALGDSAEGRALMSMARAIARHVGRDGCDGGCDRRCARHATAGRDRAIVPFEAAVDLAVANRWISTDVAGRFTVGVTPL